MHDGGEALASVMKIDFDRQMLDQNGAVILMDSGAKMTALSVCVGALLAQEDGASAEEKHKKFTLWHKIRKGGEVELNVEEASLLRRVVGDIAPTLLMGQVWHLLDKS